MKRGLPDDLHYIVARQSGPSCFIIPQGVVVPDTCKHSSLIAGCRAFLKHVETDKQSPLGTMKTKTPRRSFLQKLGLGFGMAAMAGTSAIAGDEQPISYTRFDGKWIRFKNGQIDKFVTHGEVMDMVGLDGLKKMVDQDDKRRRVRMQALLR